MRGAHVPSCVLPVVVALGGGDMVEVTFDVQMPEQINEC